MKQLLLLLHTVLFRKFAGPAAIAGNVGKWQEENPKLSYLAASCGGLPFCRLTVLKDEGTSRRRCA